MDKDDEKFIELMLKLEDIVRSGNLSLKAKELEALEIDFRRLKGHVSIIEINIGKFSAANFLTSN